MDGRDKLPLVSKVADMARIWIYRQNERGDSSDRLIAFQWNDWLRCVNAPVLHELFGVCHLLFLDRLRVLFGWTISSSSQLASLKTLSVDLAETNVDSPSP